MKKIAIIYGAPSEYSRLRGITDYYALQLAERGNEVKIIYPQQLPADKLLGADFTNEVIQAAVRKVAEADAVIVATPVYKASFSGFIKVFMDMLPQRGLEDKVVLPVAIGGTLAHLLMIDYAVRPVVTAMANSHCLQGVYAIDKWVTKQEDGSYSMEADLEVRIQDSIEKLLLAL